MRGTKQEAERLQAIEDKIRGRPSRGVHVGAGRHVDMDGPERHGWTIHEKPVVQVGETEYDYEWEADVTVPEVEATDKATKPEKDEIKPHAKPGVP